MEFHAIFHGIPCNSRAAKWHITLFHGIPWNIPWNSMELWCRQMTYHLDPWNSMEHSMEFHGTLVPPNDISLSSMEFHGTTHWHFMAFTLAGLPSDIQWNSREIWSRQIKNHRVTWDSMELRGHHFKWHKYFMEFHGIFHGIPWNSGDAKWHIT